MRINDMSFITFCFRVELNSRAGVDPDTKGAVFCEGWRSVWSVHALSVASVYAEKAVSNLFGRLGCVNYGSYDSDSDSCSNVLIFSGEIFKGLKFPWDSGLKWHIRIQRSLICGWHWGGWTIYTDARVSFLHGFPLAKLSYNHIVTMSIPLHQKLWHIDALNSAQIPNPLFKNAQMCTLALGAAWPSKADLRDRATWLVNYIILLKHGMVSFSGRMLRPRGRDEIGILIVYMFASS
jgi:hypothetical protein